MLNNSSTLVNRREYCRRIGQAVAVSAASSGVLQLTGWGDRVGRTFAADVGPDEVQHIGNKATAGDVTEIESRIRGLWIGSLIGDALGGPIEFQDPAQAQALVGGPKKWHEGELIDRPQRQAAAARLALLPYAPLRPLPEPYAHWRKDAPAGTITDDSRHKLILWDAVRKSQRRRLRLTQELLAESYLEWPTRSNLTRQEGYAELAQQWLDEYQLAARWVLGSRDPQIAIPPERIWAGWPTCCGQMALPPLATLFPGQPAEAYQLAFEIDFIDVGWGRDLNCGLVAALAAALTTDVDPRDPFSAWSHLIEVLLKTDPYRYNAVPWSERAASRWLNLARRLVKESGKSPARLFALLTQQFSQTTKWHAEVPFVVVFACLEIAEYDPLAALQLTIEWGEDTDSYAQLLGAFLGALYGEELFPVHLRKPVVEQLREFYGVDFDQLARVTE